MSARILVADDDDDIRHLITFSLQRSGFEVEAVGDGDAAFDAITANPPALAVLDVQMPGRTGLQVVDALADRGGSSPTPVLLVSASAQQAEIDRGLATGAAGYLTKPFTPRALVDKVREILGEQA
jgi:CheY-like chemotaxis protein